ncbi:MAG: cbb3-type cytochrome c oxidase subunit I [Myxococcaceae bacterium]|nr:cbb3-type cytochrome c oxidase subunit I [Myxococcaceae bacterium]
MSAPQGFLRRYVFSVDHKVIAKQFLFAGLVFLALGGFLAMLIRWQWAYPGRPVPGLHTLLAASDGAITPPVYQSIFTLHGLTMIFWAITPVLIGAFGNFLLPLQIGARDMAFPRLNAWSFWTFLLSGVLLLASFFAQLGTSGAGWTGYPPLSGPTGSPGVGQTLVVAAVFVTGVSTIMGGINYVTTVIRLRAPGMTWFRLPVTVWGLFLTSVLNVLFVPVLGSAALLLLLDRLFGTAFFAAGAAVGPRGGDPILYQHLFWIFGHPEVYILILPVWGVVSDLLSFFGRKPAYWYRGTVYALIAVTVLSALVYGHHMYQVGLHPLLGKAFMFFTVLISFPGMVLVMNWLSTLWRGSNRFTPPMLFALGTVFVFGVGGVTGLSLAGLLTDIYLHDTLWVVGHFHLTMAAAVFLGSMAALHFWFPKMFGRELNSRLATVHFGFTFVLLCLVFFGQLLAGWSGQQRRLADPYQYDFIKPLLPLNKATSHAAFLLAASQLLFVWNFFHSLFRGKKAEANPWNVGTLEWTHAPSPPPHHNFDTIPTVVRGPHEFSTDEAKARGTDWLPQAEGP